MESYLAAIVGFLFVTLCGLVGWIGVRIFNRLDEIGKAQMENYRDFCTRIEGFYAKISDGDNILHGRITEMDRRLTRVETRCTTHHGEFNGHHQY